MNIREYYEDRFKSLLLRFAVLVLVLSFSISLNLYLRKVHASQENDIKQLETIRAKINRMRELSVTIDKLSTEKIKNPEFKLAELLDSLNKNFPELKIDLSQERKEGDASLIPYSIKGDSNFERFLVVLDFLDRYDYPICLINSAQLKKNQNVLNFEIKGDFGVIK